MPELPEVETIRRDLSQHIVGARIARVELLWPGVVALPDADTFPALVQGRRVAAVRRRGKYLIWELDDESRLLIHLRMTGRLYWPPPGEPRADHVRAVFHLIDHQRPATDNRRAASRGRLSADRRRPAEDRRELHFVDQRKFGRLYRLAGERELHALLVTKLGPEPLESGFTREGLRDALARRRGPIKAVLLDQRLLAGLGNIYVDEALFRAGLHPVQPAQSLSAAQVDLLHGAIVAALRQGIANRGTTLAAYRDAWGTRGLNQEQLLVFRRQGRPCPACGTPIAKMRVGGRGTHFCPQCQGFAPARGDQPSEVSPYRVAGDRRPTARPADEDPTRPGATGTAVA